MKTADAPAPSGFASAEFQLQPRHRPWLDGWRGVAILCVIVGHLASVPGMKPARFGVELFFVLSGRLMAQILFVNRQPLGYFLKRRVARVWPALYAYVVIMALALVANPEHRISLGQFAGAVTFTFNYVRIVGEPALAFDHLWSLCVEEWAYLFLGLIAVAARRFHVQAAYAILIIAMLAMVNGAVQTLMGLTYREVYWRTDVRVSSIFMACALFILLRERPVLPWFPVFAGVIGTFLNTYLFGSIISYSFGSFFLALAVVTIDAAHPLVLRILSSPLMTRIGLWSFSLYLWQQPFTKLFPDWPIPLKLAALTAAALVSFYMIEQPARRWLNRVWAIRPGSAKPDTPAAKPRVPAHQKI